MWVKWLLILFSCIDVHICFPFFVWFHYIFSSLSLSLSIRLCIMVCIIHYIIFAMSLFVVIVLFFVCLFIDYLVSFILFSLFSVFNRFPFSLRPRHGSSSPFSFALNGRNLSKRTIHIGFLCLSSLLSCFPSFLFSYFSFL